MGFISGLINRAAGASRRGTRGGAPLGPGPATGGMTGGVTGGTTGRSGVGGLLGRLSRGRRRI